MPELAPELWILLPLAIAAGIDLYLTLLVLGAAPTLPWWDHPLPGALGDLDAPAILIVVGVVYLLEFTAERQPASALVWNAVHALIRPVSGALLAALLLHGQTPAVLLAGSLAGGFVASLAHAVRSGGAIVRWLDPSPDPHVLLVSMFEDTLVLGLTVASLDAPPVALGAALVLVLLAAPRAAVETRAFVFAIRFAASRVFQSFRERSWRRAERLPKWVRDALADDVMAPGGGLRGAPAAVLRMPGLPRFTTGWVVVRGDDPAFVYGRGGRQVELGALRAVEVRDEGFFRTLELRGENDHAVRIFFFVNGPSAAAIEAEFGVETSDASGHRAWT
ncbi:MAG: DUF4126 domain-containing protein [Gemmatimonadota bacterium]